MNRKNVLICFVIIVLFIGFSFIGCGVQETEKAEDQKLTFNLSSDPESIDPGRTTGQPDLTLVNAVMEGLTRYGPDGELKPAVAEDWDISGDGRVYKFYIRENAQWSNGESITAYDFEYAWKRVLDPEFASSFAYKLYYLENAAAYNNPENTEVTSPDVVGVEAVDDKILEVTLEEPVPYFLGLTAFPAFFPVPEETVEVDSDWHSDSESYVSNGPFKIKDWKEYQSITCEKNDKYWDNDSVNIEELVFTFVGEESTALSMYETGEIDMLCALPSQELERLENEYPNEFAVADELSVAKYIFNINKEPLDDVRVRRALAKAVNRSDIVEHVTRAGERPAHALVPYGLTDVDEGDDFRKVGGNYFEEDVEKARELLEDAGYPDGDNFPELELLINDTQDNIMLAQAVQEMWKQNLGITEIEVRPMEWRVYLGEMMGMNHDIAGAGWVADYADPMAFLEVYTSWSGNNVSGFSSQDYDDEITLALESKNPEVRIPAMHRAEEILMDSMPVMPLVFYTKPYLAKEQVKDVIVPSFGPLAEFKWAYIEK